VLAWRQVEEALTDVAKRKGFAMPARQSSLPVHVGRMLQQGELDPANVAIFNDLRALRTVPLTHPISPWIKLLFWNIWSWPQDWRNISKHYRGDKQVRFMISNDFRGGALESNQIAIR
jgi:hypothetical protein